MPSLVVNAAPGGADSSEEVLLPLDNLQHVIDTGDLDAGATLGCAAFLLVAVQGLPAVKGDKVGLWRDHSRASTLARSRFASEIPGSVAKSSTIAATVDTASGLLVPMTPLGPRLAHPTQYSPGIGALSVVVTTRPATFIIVNVFSSKGTPLSGTLR